MKRLAITLTILTVVAVVAFFTLGYVAIFTRDGAMGWAAYLTLCLGLTLGFAAGFAWDNGGAR